MNLDCGLYCHSAAALGIAQRAPIHHTHTRTYTHAHAHAHAHAHGPQLTDFRDVTIEHVTNAGMYHSGFPHTYIPHTYILFHVPNGHSYSRQTTDLETIHEKTKPLTQTQPPPCAQPLFTTSDYSLYTTKPSFSPNSTMCNPCVSQV